MAKMECLERPAPREDRAHQGIKVLSEIGTSLAVTAAQMEHRVGKGPRAAMEVRGAAVGMVAP
jgi:hypothetical protein